SPCGLKRGFLHFRFSSPREVETMGSLRRARLLPALLLAVAGWLLPAVLPSAFQAPLAPGRVQPAGQRQLGQLRQSPAAGAGVLAGSQGVRPGALPPRGRDAEAAWEA
ncbi:unnamed protein product, partial [Prorocentrum cordatum]